MFQDLAILVLQSGNWELYREDGHFWTHIDTYSFSMVIRLTQKIHPDSKREMNREPFCAIFFHKSRRGLT